MSFTSIVKSEVSKVELFGSENISELSAIIRNSNYQENSIKITTENASVARHIYSLIKDVYDISPIITARKGYNYQKKFIYIVEIKQKKAIILSDLCIDNGDLNNVPKDYLVADEELKRAYIKGVFLITGSVNDPKKSRYHLEFIVDNEKYANFISDLLNTFDLNSKVLKRESKFMVYIKEAEKIGDFLRLIKASNAVLYYEDIRIYRDHKNMTNRLNNCEQANIDKMIEAATKQVNDIQTIIDVVGIDLLDEKEQVVATYRLKYPEASLQELSEIITIETGKAITKSGINHRIRKIEKIANRIRTNEKK
ncbi:MAG: DNA-binding protein WhiA [Bacilli bacterium]|nr:DNA-binding protein WhiA [Bacilli bacterium]MDD4808634.1 DNA-binding protein WhiA [Bacilli bacterium]